ncbi:MAG TPA: hypothetical protein DGP25_04215 [Brevundimonas sp.]|nr:hypothetical protein [Brevundimonas sp.]
MLEVTSEAPEDFSISDYASRSFGVYHDQLEEVRLRFSGDAVGDAQRWRFHPGQTLSHQPDGSLIIAFQTGGMLELAWHPFTWRGDVEILSPERLRTVMLEELQHALSRHGSSATETVAKPRQA